MSLASLPQVVPWLFNAFSVNGASDILLWSGILGSSWVILTRAALGVMQLQGSLARMDQKMSDLSMQVSNGFRALQARMSALESGVKKQLDDFKKQLDDFEKQLDDCKNVVDRIEARTAFLAWLDR